MKRIVLKPSTKLQLQAALGILLASPAWLLFYELPGVHDWPLWLLIGFPVGSMLACFVWFRQCMAPDGTSFKPRW
ncbi:hypothetical protein Q4S45_03280 [Massilia sp. R2A-15]|uniref:hypothetical protein n=1 Tax=Massilia sp. R2A-15 TaxID=3064278 RepID=UPI0027340845|nr:hypothetical protein [Massilia sp. R2A-15]WLI90160.1 hypothetical protein Q4S45_03280 [Massilia sp. R2A-15]